MSSIAERPKKFAELTVVAWSGLQPGRYIRLFLHPATALTANDKVALNEELCLLRGVRYTFFQEAGNSYILTVVLEANAHEALCAELQEKLAGKAPYRAC